MEIVQRIMNLQDMKVFFKFIFQKLFFFIKLVFTAIVPGYSNEDLTEYTSTFISQGFEEMTTLITFFLYELAKNKKIQNNLYNEIQANTAPSYYSINNMKYLDMCLCGTYT